MPVVPTETLQELIALRQRVADLEAEIEDLRGKRHDAVKALHANLGTSVGESMMLTALAQGGVLHREQLLAFAHKGAFVDDVRLVDSAVKRIRKRLPWIQIQSHYGFGYELEGESLVRVREAMRCRR